MGRKDTIEEFTGEYDWLSNFYPARFTYLGWMVPTSEHAFQLAKGEDYSSQRSVALCRTPRDAKRQGRMITLREDWEKVKDSVMMEVIILKFTLNPDLREKLLDTGTRKLIEGNYWGDSYWGVDLNTGKGQNQLGKTLMEVRKMLQ